MYIIIRLILGGVFLVCSIIAVKKSKAIRKRVLYIVLAGLSVLSVVGLTFLPIENLFLNFDSPTAVYKYLYLGKSNIELVVEGDSCDFVVGHNDESDTYLIVLKAENGWKIGIGSNIKKPIQKLSDGVVVYIYRYKDTSDYFITVLDTKGGESTISDEYNTEFLSLEKDNEFLEKTFVTYYAHIRDISPQYTLTVNGNELILA